MMSTLEGASRAPVPAFIPANKADVEKAHLTTAIVSANEVPKGTLVKTGKGYSFAFKKMADGTWQSAAFEKDSK
jgi:hypothetical protein